MPSKYVLLDRDGVINRRTVDGYVTSWKEFWFLPGALEGLRLLEESGYKAIVVSNQAGVGKGLLTSENLAELTRRFCREVEKHGGRIHGVYYCLHRDEDGCDCRKPKPGLLRQAQREHRFDLSDTFLVGDAERDLIAAQRAGCLAVLVAAEEPTAVRDWPHAPRATVPDLYAAAQFILGGTPRPG